MRTVTTQLQSRYALYFAVFIFFLLLKSSTRSDEESDEASLKLWKSLDPDSRKLIYQLRKLTEADQSEEEDDLSDIDDDVEFSSDEQPKLVGDQTTLKHFFGLPPMPNNLPQFNMAPTGPKRKAVLLIGNFRSGSSFVSQMLNQRNDVFFLFDPLAPFGASCTKELDLKNHVLFRYARCRFPNMEEVFRKQSAKKETSWTATTCIQHRICYRHRSKKLLEAPFCPNDFSTEKVKQAEILKVCGGINLQLAQRVCLETPLVGAKVIRVCRVADLKHLLLDSEIEWRFMWIVRDPRAIAASQEHTKGDEEVDTCNHMAANINYLNSPMARWLQGKLMIVRYEDVAFNPKGIIDRTNKFLDLSEDVNVLQWFDDNTKTEPIGSWQTSLSPQQVSDVQRKCSQVMGAMGYKLVNPKDTQLHDLDHLIVPWRNGVPNWIEMLTQKKL